MNEEEWEKWEKEKRELFQMPPEYQAALTRMSRKYAEDTASLATATAKSSARAAWASAGAAWASFAIAVLSLVFQGVPALLDALRLASKQ